MSRALATALALAVLVLAPSVAAHGDGGARGYTAAVKAVVPALPGVTVTVLGADDRLRLVNRGGGELVVLGYDGEPYLRFDGDGVWENSRSPAAYLNDDRYGDVELPATADARAEPSWRRVGRTAAHEWHDHRIHWMSPVDPPQVRREPTRAHHVLDWTVPLRVAGRQAEIRGTLDYAPPAGRPPWILPVLFVGAALALGGVAVRVRGRRG